jgi:hypothetical protein
MQADQSRMAAAGLRGAALSTGPFMLPTLFSGMPRGGD